MLRHPLEASKNIPEGWTTDQLEWLDHCPVCRSQARQLFYSGLKDVVFGVAPGSWNLYRCHHCKAAYLDPRPNEEHIGRTYINYYTHAAPGAVSGKTSRIVGLLRKSIANGYRNYHFGTNYYPATRLGGRLAALFLPEQRAHWEAEGRGIGRAEGSPPPKILDVGCGNGEFLRLAASLGWSACGVEPDPQAAAAADAAGLNVIAGRAEDLCDYYKNEFAVVTLSHVAEHLHNPLATLVACRSLLRPGGNLWIETPNLDSIGFEWYGCAWRGLETPRHLVLFNWQSLLSLLTAAGFEEITLLPSRPVREELFYKSERALRGLLAEVPMREDSVIRRTKVRKLSKEAAILVKQAPHRAEFLTVSARKPLS